MGRVLLLPVWVEGIYQVTVYCQEKVKFWPKNRKMSGERERERRREREREGGRETERERERVRDGKRESFGLDTVHSFLAV